jgi:phosphoglycerate dehydrogenase-like enzyme
MPNVIVTPHVAGYGPRIAERHLALLLDNIRRYRQHEKLRNVVNKAKWF